MFDAPEHIVAEIIGSELHTLPLPGARHALASTMLGATLNRAFHCGDRGPDGWFMGPSDGSKAAAIAYTLIETAKLNGLDPQAWLAEVLPRIPDHPSN